MALLLYGACAAAYALLAALILVQSRRSRTGWRLAACCVVTAVWAATEGALGTAPEASAATPGAAHAGGLAHGLDLLRAVCWYGFILHLYRRSVPGAGQAWPPVTAGEIRFTGWLGLLKALYEVTGAAGPGLTGDA